MYIYLAKTTTTMTMARALVDTGADGRNLAEASPCAVIFTMTVVFDGEVRRIGMVWV